MFLGGDHQDSVSINRVDQAEDWEELVAVMDSGAADSVAPPHVARGTPIRESAGSKAGQTYYTADGSRIPNQGEKTVVAFTDQEVPLAMRYQIADVTKPLNSVGEICDKDNYVVFGAQGGYIKDRWSPNKTFFRREYGVYVLRTWIP